VAGKLAKPSRLPITLFSVLDRNGELPAAIADAAELAIANLKLEGVAAETLLRPGRIADGILAATRETGADLVVLYRHKRGGLNRKLLGSVSDQVIRTAQVPVLLVGEATQTGIGATG
jgi:nucleotide-binding universal stress UspA family protein